MTLPWLDDHRRDFNQRLAGGRLGHAPLIHGPEGSGKLELARWLTARLLCLQPQDGEPCRSCRSCQLLAVKTHPDLFEVDIPEDRNVIPVDSIRELIAGMQLTPAVARNRVGLIVQADAMNINAANALLKTLEEPPAAAWLILRCSRPGALPATVRSRCQPVSVAPPANETALDWLAQVAPEQSGGQRELALALADGAPLTARAMLADEDLEFGLEVLRQLGEPGGPSPAELQRWAGSAAMTWRWLARWTAVHMRHLHGGTPLPDGIEATAGRARAEDLSKLWQQALEGLRLAAAGSVRQDLLLGKWLLEWQSVRQPRN